MHSYMSTNGYLLKVNHNLERKMDALRSATSRVGGWDTALSDARAAKDESERRSGSTSDELSASPSITPLPDGTKRSYIDGDMAIALRDRLLAMPATNGEANADGESPTDSNASLPPRSTAPRDTYKVLLHHPDKEISSIVNDMMDMDLELTSAGPGQMQWPNNITWKNFAEYMLIPSLVYELEYPRTERQAILAFLSFLDLTISLRIRPFYVFEKTVATFGTFALLYTITENFILPHVPTSRDRSFFRSLLDLALPFMVAYLLLFYIIFGEWIWTCNHLRHTVTVV